MNRRIGILGAAILLLSAQAAMTHWLSREEFLPNPAPINETIPLEIGGWSRYQDGVLDSEAYAVLAPDDVLNRTYRKAAAASELSLFIGYYKTQLRAKNAHDPKVCLPGAGWNPLLSEQIPVEVPGLTAPIQVNHYVIGKGGEEAVVVYWFQNHKKAYAEEQALRFARVLDNLTENRTDMALVRVVISATKQGRAAATKEATAFVSALYPSLIHQFPAN
jgi:EpsI family protein